MLVQALAAYADRYLGEQLSDESMEEKPVPVLLEIGKDGEFLGATRRYHTVKRGKKEVRIPLPMMVPRSPVPRNSGVYPLLGVDDIKYVLGCGPWTTEKDRANHAERHAGFVELIERAAQATGDEALSACARFYDRPEQVEAARTALGKEKTGTLIGLSREGALNTRAAVRDYWRRHYENAAAQRASGDFECLISGKRGPIALTHEKIKGLAGLGGQPAGVALMSFDKDAFRSYGWDQNINSPVAPDRAMAYVLALNDLLKPGSTRRRDCAGIAFVFWTRDPDKTNYISVIEEPTEEDVQNLLSFDSRADLDPNQFYMAGLGANGARLVVRYWVSEALPAVRANLRAWFNGLKMIGAEHPPRMWQLRQALGSDGNQVPGSRTLALVRRAIEGPSKPLGKSVLAAVMTRLRADQDLRRNPAAMGLVRICINDAGREGQKAMSEELDAGQNNGAYLCGRLLAVYEGLQWTANKRAGEREVNVSVADRYYSLASTNPSVAFPKLEDLGRKHLKKLSRSARGAMIAIEKEIVQLHDAIGTGEGRRFPGALSLVDQGRFALGYYHQRAQNFENARLFKEANEENEGEQA